jgi:hypothetical protein
LPAGNGTEHLAFRGNTPASTERPSAHAYNHYVTEILLPANPRLKPVLYLPFNDAEASYKMAKNFDHMKGVVGFMVVSTCHKSIYENAHIKLYSLLREVGLPPSFTLPITGKTRSHRSPIGSSLFTRSDAENDLGSPVS